MMTQCLNHQCMVVVHFEAANSNRSHEGASHAKRNGPPASGVTQGVQLGVRFKGFALTQVLCSNRQRGVAVVVDNPELSFQPGIVKRSGTGRSGMKSSVLPQDNPKSDHKITFNCNSSQPGPYCPGILYAEGWEVKLSFFREHAIIQLCCFKASIVLTVNHHCPLDSRYIRPGRKLARPEEMYLLALRPGVCPAAAGPPCVVTLLKVRKLGLLWEAEERWKARRSSSCSDVPNGHREESLFA
jgi:hypothetical protein